MQVVLTSNAQEYVDSSRQYGGELPESSLQNCIFLPPGRGRDVQNAVAPNLSHMAHMGSGPIVSRHGALVASFD